MPTELKRLLVYATIGWMAYFSTTLFFTDYIAQVNFHKIKIVCDVVVVYFDILIVCYWW